MITADGWFDWMDREPGPADKVYSQPCKSELYIPHSAVGYYQGWKGRLFSTDRLPNGNYTPYAAASVTGWFFQEAGRRPVQHYPLTASCWASGTRELNTRGNAFENAGGPASNPSEPLTKWQEDCNLRAIKEIGEWKGRPVSYWIRPSQIGDLKATLYEHRESVWFGGLPTACPSGRAAPIWARLGELQEEDDMFTDDDRKTQNLIKQALLDSGANDETNPEGDRRIIRISKATTHADAELDTVLTKLDEVLTRLTAMEEFLGV